MFKSTVQLGIVGSLPHSRLRELGNNWEQVTFFHNHSFLGLHSIFIAYRYNKRLLFYGNYFGF